MTTEREITLPPTPELARPFYGADMEAYARAAVLADRAALREAVQRAEQRELEACAEADELRALLREQESVLVGVGPITCRNGKEHERHDGCLYCEVERLKGEVQVKEIALLEWRRAHNDLQGEVERLRQQVAELDALCGKAAHVLRLVRTSRRAALAEVTRLKERPPVAEVASEGIGQDGEPPYWIKWLGPKAPKGTKLYTMP